MSVKFHMKLAKMGGSYRVTIPKPIIEALELEKGDELTIWIESSKIIIEKQKEPV